MRTAELLNAMAAWLESPNNEAMLLAEENEDCLHVVAESCVLAAQLLKKAAEEVDFLEPAEPSLLTPQTIEETAALATALDESGDPQLKKMASVLDELLLTIAAPPGALADKKAQEHQRFVDLQKKFHGEEIQKKYHDVREKLREHNKISATEKAIADSGMTKEYRIMEAPLNTRTCPDHPGAQIARVGENMYQCELDKKVYNYQTGYTMNDGTKVPGGDVSQQTQNLNVPFQSLFDSREGRLGANRT
jgi:hypothetical protein